MGHSGLHPGGGNQRGHLSGGSGEGYHTRNFTYAQLCIGTILGRIIVGKLFLKPYYDYKVVSIYEYLEKDSGS